MGTRLYDVRYGANLIITPRPLVQYMGVQSTGDFQSDLSPPESLNTWLVSITRTTLLKQFGTEQAFLAAVNGNVLWAIRRELSVNWINVRSYGTETVDGADSYQVTLKSLGFNDVVS
jgi:hypothetical protein